MQEQLYEPDMMDLCNWTCTGKICGSNPKIVVKLKNSVDAVALQKAMENTQKRYVLLQIKCVLQNEQIYYMHNDKEFIIKKGDLHQAQVLGKGANDYPWLLYYSGQTIVFSFNHGLMDGQSILEIIKTLLYYYFSALNIVATGDHHIKTLLDDVAAQTALEMGMVCLTTSQLDSAPFLTTKQKKADILQEKAMPNYTNKALKITINATELAVALKKYNTTPFAFLAPLLAISLKSYYKNPMPIIKFHIPIDVKGIVKSKSLKNAVDSIVVCYDSTKMDSMRFENIVTCFRSTIDLAAGYDNIVSRMKATCKRMRVILKIKPFSFRSWVMTSLIPLLTGKDTTVTLSNVGKIRLPKEFEELVEEVYPMISTTISPIMVEMVGLSDILTLSITQRIAKTDYLEKFIALLGDYDVSARLEDCGKYVPNIFEKTW